MSGFNPSTHTPDGTPIGAIYAYGLTSAAAPDPGLQARQAEQFQRVAAMPACEARLASLASQLIRERPMDAHPQFHVVSMGRRLKPAAVHFGTVWPVGEMTWHLKFKDSMDRQASLPTGVSGEGRLDVLRPLEDLKRWWDTKLSVKPLSPDAVRQIDAERRVTNELTSPHSHEQSTSVPAVRLLSPRPPHVAWMGSWLEYAYDCDVAEERLRAQIA